MFLPFNNVTITDSALELINASFNNEPILEYADGIVKEYAVDSTLFKSNIDLSSTIVTAFTDSNVPKHTDEGRYSCLIVPLTNEEFKITVKDKVHSVNFPFILDTSVEHSAVVSPNVKVLCIDLRLKYNEIIEALDKEVLIDAK